MKTTVHSPIYAPSSYKVNEIGSALSNSAVRHTEFPVRAAFNSSMLPHIREGRKLLMFPENFAGENPSGHPRKKQRNGDKENMRL
ncbi:hypothetical protein E2C01_043795 [Portunus trituberculatus]|uniref:Uncharacterized protein n=1 Tax=Portunus trituberculatus TaxID=210409 RepID=A0A5B7FX26_PORTR|nr:hypothetical protein [Portunus trituberculatus]